MAALSGLATTSMVIERRHAELAVRLFPWNGSARGRVADAYFYRAHAAKTRNESAPALEQRAQREALASLAQQALNPRALRIIAMTSPEREQMRDLLVAGDGLSRRDSVTQVMLVEQAARDGNVKAALRHYDALLRRKTGYRDAAGRGLAVAVAEPELAIEVAALLRRRPPWSSLLYHYLVKEPRSFDGFVQIHRILAGQSIIPRATSEAFAQTLIGAGRIDDAIEVARLSGATPLSRTNGLTEHEFRKSPAFPGSWSILEGSAVSIEPIRDGGLSIAFSRGAAGALAHRLLALQPGQYRTSVTRESEQGPNDASSAEVPVEARLSCVERESDSSGTQSLRVDCPYQWLTLYMPNAAEFDGEIYVSAVEVRSDG